METSQFSVGTIFVIAFSKKIGVIVKKTSDLDQLDIHALYTYVIFGTDFEPITVTGESLFRWLNKKFIKVLG